MQQGLDVSGGLIVAEAVMMELAPHLGRQVAHDVVYECCRRALSGQQSFLDALLAEAKITGVLDRDELVRLVNPANYLGAAPAMTRRLLRRRVES
jgi:3-carboxy-cis,cis-muconate cycloisomerase